jgi:hypothetical protein
MFEIAVRYLKRVHHLFNVVSTPIVLKVKLK